MFFAPCVQTARLTVPFLCFLTDLEGARHNGTRNPLRGEHKRRRGAGIKPSEEEEEEQKKEKILPWCWRGREICKEGFALSVGGACSP